MRMTSVVAAAAAVLMLSSSAFAAFESVGDAYTTNSWTQQFEEKGVGDYDYMQFFMTSAGDTWKLPAGINSFNKAGWAQTYNDGTLMIASGSTQTSMRFNLVFEGAKSDPLSFNIQAWFGDVLKENADVQWTGSKWIVTAAAGQAEKMVPPVPEPVFFQMGALMGMSGLGVLRLRRKS